MLRFLENAILRLVFANTVFHDRAILLIFDAEFTESGALEGNADQRNSIQFMYLSYRAAFSCGWFNFQEKGTFMIRFYTLCTKRTNASGSVKVEVYDSFTPWKHKHCVFRL